MGRLTTSCGCPGIIASRDMMLKVGFSSSPALGLLGAIFMCLGFLCFCWFFFSPPQIPSEGLPAKAREQHSGLPQPQLPSRAAVCHPLSPHCGWWDQCHVGDHKVKLKQEGTPQALPPSATAESMASLDEPRDPLLPGWYKVCSLLLVMGKLILIRIYVKKFLCPIIIIQNR